MDDVKMDVLGPAGVMVPNWVPPSFPPRPSSSSPCSLPSLNVQCKTLSAPTSISAPHEWRKIWEAHINHLHEQADEAQKAIRNEEDEKTVQHLSRTIEIVVKLDREIARARAGGTYGYYQRPKQCPCCQGYTAYYTGGSISDCVLAPRYPDVDAGPPTAGFCGQCIFCELCQYRNFTECRHLG